MTPDHMQLGEPNVIDLGNGATARITAWAPERDINPQYDGIPDVEHWGLILWVPGQPCRGYGGQGCMSGITFEGEVQRKIQPDRPMWQLVSVSPLHVEPSILCPPDKGGCGLHGHIRGGLWVPC